MMAKIRQSFPENQALIGEFHPFFPEIQASFPENHPLEGENQSPAPEHHPRLLKIGRLRVFTGFLGFERESRGAS